MENFYSCNNCITEYSVMMDTDVVKFCTTYCPFCGSTDIEYLNLDEEEE